MKRKVNRVGKNTLTISLPTKWVKKHEVEKGDELYLKQESNELIISKEENNSCRDITINYDTLGDFSRRLFLIPYIRGYDKIIIKCKDSHVIDCVEQNMFILTGFEIVDQTKDHIILQSVANVQEANFDPVFDRLFNVVISMVLDLEEDFRGGLFDNIKNIAKLEAAANKLDFFCRRILNIRAYHDSELTNSIYCTVRYLETITDILRDLIYNTPKEEFIKDLKVASLLNTVAEILNLNRRILNLGNTTLISKCKMKENEYLKILNKLEKKVVSEYLRSVYYPLHHMNEEVIHYKEQ